MLNTVLSIAVVVVALAALVWRTSRHARDVADGTRPDGAGPNGNGNADSDLSGISGEVGEGPAGRDGGGGTRA